MAKAKATSSGPTVFDFVKSITTTKINLLAPDTQAAYVPFIVNRALSGFIDTLILSNAMNCHPWLSKEQHYASLMAGVSKAKRFAEWMKKDEVTDNLRYVMTYYGYNEKRAREVLPMLTETDLADIVQTFNTGGVGGHK